MFSNNSGHTQALLDGIVMFMFYYIFMFMFYYILHKHICTVLQLYKTSDHIYGDKNHFSEMTDFSNIDA